MGKRGNNTAIDGEEWIELVSTTNALGLCKTLLLFLFDYINKRREQTVDEGCLRHVGNIRKLAINSLRSHFTL